MINLRNDFYIAPKEDPVDQEYCFYKLELIQGNETVPIFLGKLYRSPIKKTVFGVSHQFYTRINDLLRPYIVNTILEQATSTYTYSYYPSNNLTVKVSFCLDSTFQSLIGQTATVYPNVVNINDFWGNVDIDDTKISIWSDITSVDNSLQYYPKINQYNQSINIYYSRYLNINFGLFIPFQYWNNEYNTDYEKVHSLQIKVKVKGQTAEGDTEEIMSVIDDLPPFYGGAPRFCLNVGYLYQQINNVTTFNIINELTLLVQDGDKTLASLLLPFTTYGKIPSSVGTTAFQAIYLDKSSNIQSVFFEGSSKETTTLSKSTFTDADLKEKTLSITATDAIILHTGWLNEEQTSRVQQLFCSPEIKLKKIDFGTNTYRSTVYDVLSSTTIIEQYKYVNDKKLSDIEIKLTLNTHRQFL